jgi:hypothetical protein
MSTLEKILDRYEDETFIKADGFDDAIIGIDDSRMKLIYSTRKCVDILMKDMPEEDAWEFFNYNVVGSFYENGPVFCSDDFL